MGDLKLRRLPAMDRDKRLVGILSLGDVAFEAGGGKIGEAVEQISEPGAPHNQAEEAYAGSKPGSPH